MRAFKTNALSGFPLFILLLCCQSVNLVYKVKVEKGKARMRHGVGFVPRKNSGYF